MVFPFTTLRNKLSSVLLAEEGWFGNKLVCDKIYTTQNFLFYPCSVLFNDIKYLCYPVQSQSAHCMAGQLTERQGIDLVDQDSRFFYRTEKGRN